jgi:hypothetical protein
MRIFKLLLFLLCCAVIAHAEADFTLRDYLGHGWTNERVTFVLTPAQAKHARAGHALWDEQNHPVTYQLLDDANTPRLVFLADVPAFSERGYTFAGVPAKGATDVTVEETPDAVTLGNGQIAIRLAKRITAEQGPIAGVRLRSGAWAGTSTLTGDAPVTAYTVTITQRGPVYTEAICRAAFGDHGVWGLRVQVQAGDPVVLLDEKYATDTPALLRLTLDQGFAPDTMSYRVGKTSIGKNAAWTLAADAKEPAYVLEPWLHWWERERQGNCVSLYAANGPDLLTIAAREANVWYNPAKSWERQTPSRVLLMKDDRGVHLDLPVSTGQRKWMLMTPEKDATLAVLQDPRNTSGAYFPPSPAYGLLVKHGHFPLDMVKDWTLAWKGDHDNYPRLFVTKTDLPRLRAGLQKDLAKYQSAIPGYLRNPLLTYQADGPIAAYLATGDKELGRKLTETSLAWMQGAVDNFLVQASSTMYGLGPSQGSIVPTAVAMADVALASDAVDPRERERLLAQAAFLGYAMSRADFWSPDHGYAANPNMTTSVENYKATVACFIPSHPKAKGLVRGSLTALREQVDGWSDENGGWLEAPHYAMVSYDPILATFIMARNAGFGDDLYSERMKKIISWFGKISTPPDARIGGFRHLPPIGNTYLNEPTGAFGTLAYLWKDKDPTFAATMQWMYRQHNSYAQPGIGGAYPALGAYRSIMLDPSIPEKAPAWGSELFPQTGAVLRNAYPSPRETYLYMILGRNHLHYDQDTGGIVFYGKGRALVDDFGYYGNVPPDDHNVLQSVVAGNSGVMQPQQFTATPRFDYVRGRSEAWTRQAALVKGATNDEPAYVVLNDTLQIPAPATWRMWCTTAGITVNGQQAAVQGKEDVDMDVTVLRPVGVALTTEEKTRRSVSGLFPNWSWGPMESTQTGIIATMPKGNGLAVVLYPRLKTERPPVVTALVEGKAVKVETPAGTDYVFLSAVPFPFEGDGIRFQGTAGLVQRRGNTVELALGSAGTLSAGGKTITSEYAVPQSAANLFVGGDFEDGTLSLFPAEGSLLKMMSYAGNPVQNGAPHDGQKCLAVDFAGPRTAFGVNRVFYVDATKTYRVSMKAYSAGNFTVEMGGYASDGKNANLRTADGRVWQYGFSFKGPLTDWKPLQITIGPQGSGADLAWPDGVLSVGMTFWVTGEAGTFYLDDCVFEEVK